MELGITRFFYVPLEQHLMHMSEEVFFRAELAISLTILKNHGTTIVHGPNLKLSLLFPELKEDVCSIWDAIPFEGWVEQGEDVGDVVIVSAKKSVLGNSCGISSDEPSDLIYWLG